MEETIRFGEYLRRKREQKGYSVNQLALYSGVSAAQISRIETGQRGVPKPETIRKLADALDVEYEDMMSAAGYLKEEAPSHNGDTDDPVPPEQAEFLKWVEENLESSFFYDFSKSPDEQKKEMMKSLRIVWELEKHRKPGQKQGE